MLCSVDFNQFHTNIVCEGWQKQVNNKKEKNNMYPYVRFGHVTCSSRVCLYNFGSSTTIQLTVVLHTSAVVIRCLCSPLDVLGVPLPSFLNSNTLLYYFDQFSHHTSQA